MKTVFLVRHATAVSKNKGLPDFERSLIPKGIKEARRTSRHLAKAVPAPGLFVSSPANRAIETAHLFAETLGYPTQKIQLEDVVYDGASVSALMQLLRKVEDNYPSVMMFGHDPLFSDFAHFLAPTYTQLMPKGAVLGVTFECEHWSDLTEGGGQVTYLDYPWNKTDRARWEKDACNDLAEQVARAVGDAVSALNLPGDSAADKVARAAGREVATRLFKGERKQELVRRFVLRRLSEPVPETATFHSDEQDSTEE